MKYYRKLSKHGNRYPKSEASYLTKENQPIQQEQCDGINNCYN